jgi:hypothetical protein
LDFDDQVITVDEEIVDCFNQYFSTIGSKLSDNIIDNGIDPLSFVTPVYDKSFRLRNIAIQEVLDALNLLKPKTAPGLRT